MSEKEINNTISLALNNCGFNADDDSIQKMKNWAIEHLVDLESELNELYLDDWYYLINIISPSTILPYHCYFNKYLCPITVYLIWERLKGKKLSASKRIFQELAYQAKKNEHNLKFKSLTHSVNYVIKIYESGNWITPDEFETVFNIYRKTIMKE